MGAAAGLAAGGGLLSAYSQIQAGKSAVKTANREQGYLNQQANQTINQGDYQSDLTIDKGAQTAAAQKTGFAANGIDTSSGSAARAQQSSIDTADADADQIRKNAFNQAFGLVTQGNEIVKQASANYKTSRLNALGSVITGGGQAYKFMQ